MNRCDFGRQSTTCFIIVQCKPKIRMKLRVLKILYDFDCVRAHYFKTARLLCTQSHSCRVCHINNRIFFSIVLSTHTVLFSTEFPLKITFNPIHLDHVHRIIFFFFFQNSRRPLIICTKLSNRKYTVYVETYNR